MHGRLNVKYRNIFTDFYEQTQVASFLCLEDGGILSIRDTGTRVPDHTVS